MRLLDHDEPIDPEVAASLDAIDAVLAGEPVDARYAELAEVALLLSADRPQVPPTFAQSMDAAGGAAGSRRTPRRAAPAAALAPQGFCEATGALTAGVALIVALVVAGRWAYRVVVDFFDVFAARRRRAPRAPSEPAPAAGGFGHVVDSGSASAAEKRRAGIVCHEPVVFGGRSRDSSRPPPAARSSSRPSSSSPPRPTGSTRSPSRCTT